MVNAKKISDHQMLEIYENVKRGIQERIAIPGEITISVLRETKVVKKLAISNKFPEKRSESNKKQKYGRVKKTKIATQTKRN